MKGAAARRKLSDRFIKSRKKAAPGERDEYPDALVPAMALRVTDRGHKSYVLTARYPLNPTSPARRALGDAYLGAPTAGHMLRNGALTLAEARQKAREWLDLIERGIDPKVEEARVRAAALRAQANTFAAVAASFLERHAYGPAYVELLRKADELRAADPKLDEGAALKQMCADPKNSALVARSNREGLAKKGEAKRIINGEFVKRWGPRPITDIAPEEVAAAIRAIVKRDAPYQAHNALGYVRRLFSWAIGTHEFGITASPVEQLKPKDLIGKREARDRVLADDELRAVWGAAGTMGYPYGPLFKLMILTGQREREVADMAWREVDLDKKLWTIPAERMKGGAAHEVPLAPQAVVLLEQLPRHGSCVFSTTGGEKPVNGFSKSKKRLDVAAAKLRAQARAGEGAKPEAGDALPAFVLHDLRRTARTHFSALPVQDLVRELVIAHAKPGLHKVYDQHAYREEKRHCLELWEKRLTGIVEPPADGVADLNKARAKRNARRR